MFVLLAQFITHHFGKKFAVGEVRRDVVGFHPQGFAVPVLGFFESFQLKVRLAQHVVQRLHTQIYSNNRFQYQFKPKKYLRLVMRRHPLDRLVVDFDGFGVLAFVGVEAAQVEQGGYLGGLVSPRIFQTRPVQLRTSPVHFDGLLFQADECQDESQIQMGHCEIKWLNRKYMQGII